MRKTLACDEARQWLLMPEFRGHPLDNEPDPSRWEEALQTYARIQIDMLGRTDLLQESGCVDRRFPVLMAQYDRLMADPEHLLGPGRMSPEACTPATSPSIRGAD